MGLRYRGTTGELNKHLPLTKYPSFQPQLKNTLPCEQRFLSCMPFSVYEVVRVSCLSRSQFVYAPRETFLTARKQTNHGTDKPHKQLRQCLRAMQEGNVCLQGKNASVLTRGNTLLTFSSQVTRHSSIHTFTWEKIQMFGVNTAPKFFTISAKNLT